MANVTYDNRSFVIDGQRIWLVSGALHYFRTPAALWRDRLMKACRGGLNCIETYLAWHVHEPVEGEWDFSGDCDVAEFIQQAGDLGLYVIVRPGPYVGAELDFGGLPGWLSAKSSLQCRTHNAVFTHYFDRYFRQILPRLAELQVSRGGNIVAIQNENNCLMTTMPDRLEYLNFITQMFHRAGFDIPILTANAFTEPRAPETIECVTGWDDALVKLKELRAIQPETPSIISDFRIGHFDVWGDKHSTRDGRECARRALELTGAGAQLNYYLYHGGTNFGFTAGRDIVSDQAFVTTSYDCDAPIAEGGGLTEKYYRLRPVSMMLRHMGGVLAAATADDAAVTLTDTATFSLAGPNGRVAVVTNNGNDAITTATVALHDGRTLDVDLSYCGATAVFQNAVLTEAHTLDYSNLTPIGVFGGKLFALHGAAGQKAVVCVNGHPLELTVPSGSQPLSIEHEGLCMLVLNTTAVERLWLVDGQLIIGPDFVGETIDEMVIPRGLHKYTVINADGQAVVKDLVAPKSSARTRAPSLGMWKRLRVCTEPKDDAATFTRMDRPRGLPQQGAPNGYGWYRVTVTSPRAVRKKLFLPRCEDRATIWLNGKRVGTWGRGPEARREPISIQLQRGENALTFLVDNLGRFSGGSHLGEFKGMQGHAYSATPIDPKAWRIKAGTEKDFSRRILPRNQLGLATRLRQTPPSVCEASFSLPQPMPVHLQFEGLEAPMALFCNERLVGFFAGDQGGFGDATITSDTRRGTNRLRMLTWGEVTPKSLAAAINLYRLEEDLTEGAKWRFRPWSKPEAGPIIGVQGLPVWYHSTFKAPASDLPLFLTILQSKKGQIYLNGHNLGRFWSVGPQSSYYLPECWLEELNELVIFEEYGRPPTGSRLEFRPLGPYQK